MTKYLVVRLSEIDSTNQFALNFLKQSTERKPMVFVAHAQLHGRGQRGNVWESESGKNITCSIIDFPIWPVQRYFDLNRLVSLALVQTFEKHGIAAEIKWPNDILVKRKKIAGILIENQIRNDKITSCVIGIGINVNQEKFVSEKATSMNILTNKEFDLDAVLHDVLTHIETEMMFFQLNQFELNNKRYLKKLFQLNVKAKYKDSEGEFIGIIVDVNNDGRLVVNRNGEMKTYDMKEITFLF